MYTSHYTGGVNGWGNMVTYCNFCGELVAEYECDEYGKCVNKIFDDCETHECNLDDKEE